MILSNKEVFFASLIGSKAAEAIPRFALVQNELAKRVLPPVPFFPIQNQETEILQQAGFDGGDLWEADKPRNDQFFPISFRKRIPGEPFYRFPYEPMLSISGKNNIVKRNIAKAKDYVGTVKEFFSQDDYEITITGAMIGAMERGSSEDCFPRAEFEKLKEYCTYEGGIEVLCEPLQLLGIDFLVVESFTFPFTKGENVQAYEITCSSDFTSNFLLEIE